MINYKMYIILVVVMVCFQVEGYCFEQGKSSCGNNQLNVPIVNNVKLVDDSLNNYYNLSARIEYIDSSFSIFHGSYVVFNGETAVYSVNYCRGIKCGTERVYKKGKLKSVGFYDTGKLNYYISFYSDSNVKEEYGLLNEKKHGIYKLYYPSGQLWESSEYRLGKKCGFETEYSKKGKVKVKYQYDNDVLIKYIK